MKNILIFFSCVILLDISLAAQVSLSEIKKYFQEYESRNLFFSDSLWGISIENPIIIFEENSQKAFLNIFVKGSNETDGFFEIALDSIDVLLREPIINWKGKNWVVLDASKARNFDQNLEYLFHESFHLIQDSLGINGSLPKFSHLSQAEGLFLIYLEIQELICALNSQEKASICIDKALAYRSFRNQLFPSALDLERRAELNEGLAKYTGLVYAGTTDSILNEYYISTIEKSILRNSEGVYPYLSGSLYAFLNDKSGKSWRLKIPTCSLDEICMELYELDSFGRIVDFNDKNYFDHENLELLNRLQNQMILYDTLKELFSNELILLQISGAEFQIKSNFVFSLEERGTVYNNIEVTNDWGVLKVFSEGRALVSEDNKSLFLNVKACSLDNLSIEGSGWILKLSKGWKFKSNNNRYFLVKIEDE